MALWCCADQAAVLVVLDDEQAQTLCGEDPHHI